RPAGRRDPVAALRRGRGNAREACRPPGRRPPARRRSGRARRRDESGRSRRGRRPRRRAR
ncbi:MAG: succinyl-diaminopimelate desuccinylase, partial [Alphaproteobacteria bacterium]|nr:succinyl-diaminopimelate desuccinylase [Alphaproteobacteria bacterium]